MQSVSFLNANSAAVLLLLWVAATWKLLLQLSPMPLLWWVDFVVLCWILVAVFFHNFRYLIHSSQFIFHFALELFPLLRFLFSVYFLLFAILILLFFAFSFHLILCLWPKGVMRCYHSPKPEWLARSCDSLFMRSISWRHGYCVVLSHKLIST